MVSDEILLNYLDWKITLMVHSDDYVKQLDTIISKNKNQLPSY